VKVVFHREKTER